jgi:hypothetical protein
MVFFGRPPFIHPSTTQTASFKDYASSLKRTPQLVAKRAFYIRTAEDAAGAGGDKSGGDDAPQLARTLGWFQVMFVGVGAFAFVCPCVCLAYVHAQRHRGQLCPFALLLLHSLVVTSSSPLPHPQPHCHLLSPHHPSKSPKTITIKA